MRTPDFFIVGAPKCGTTSLATWLAGHPHVFMSPIKEPNYYTFDAPRRRTVPTLDRYQKLFASAQPFQLCGEASTSYLFSDVAVPAIIASNARAKIIAIVRNPLDMVISEHAQKLYNHQENEEYFERAWRLSPERRRGLMVGRLCLDPRQLDYQSIGRLGWQIERLLAWVPRGQLHVIVFDDLQADPGLVHRGVQQFLGVLPKARDDFPIMNVRKERVCPGLSRFLRQPPASARWLKHAVRRYLPGHSRRLGALISRLNTRPGRPRPLSAPLHREMIETFRSDVTLLGKLLGRDLQHWLREP
jgi:Sulfotransferase domain